MAEIFRRVRAIADDEKMADEGKIRLVASTSEPVSWGNWREALSHDEGAVDMSAARSLLVNHDPDQLAGGITGMVCDGRQMTSEAEIDEDARMRSGVSVRKAVKKRQLNGVSIGYTYDRADTVFDEETRTLTVRKWRLLEISLTPIPADGRAQVRALPFEQAQKVTVTGGDTHSDSTSSNTVTFSPDATPASPQKEQRMSADTNKPNTQGPETAPKIDEAARAREIADLRQRAERAENEAKVRAVAAEHGLSVDGIDFAAMKGEADGLRMLMQRKAEKEATPKPKQPVTEIRVDAADKARDAMTGALMHAAGFRSEKERPLQDANPLVGRGIQGMVLRYATMIGENTQDWDKTDVAWYALGKREMVKGLRSANVTTGMFPNFVFLNAITKIVARGYEMGAEMAQYRRIVSEQTVPDFKTFYIGALGVGNLTQTAENQVFPELDKSEGVYSNTAKMWGGTMALSFQAVVNDDTGSFNRNLAQAGAIADKTFDRRAFQKLLMGTSAAEATSTWTSNTSSGCSPVWTTADTLAAARAKVNVGVIALMKKTGLDGNPIGTMAKYFIAGPTVGHRTSNGPDLTQAPRADGRQRVHRRPGAGGVAVAGEPRA
jgi:HK97 family phage prohead protease